MVNAARRTSNCTAGLGEETGRWGKSGWLSSSLSRPFRARAPPPTARAPYPTHLPTVRELGWTLPYVEGVGPLRCDSGTLDRTRMVSPPSTSVPHGKPVPWIFSPGKRSSCTSSRCTPRSPEGLIPAIPLGTWSVSTVLSSEGRSDLTLGGLLCIRSRFLITLQLHTMQEIVRDAVRKNRSANGSERSNVRLAYLNERFRTMVRELAERIMFIYEYNVEWLNQVHQEGEQHDASSRHSK